MLAEQTFGRWAIGVFAVMLAISGLFGGWQRAESEPTKAGVPIDGGPWTVTIADARLVGDMKPMTLRRKENHWIAVVATIEITVDATWTNLREIIQLPQTEGIDNDADGLTSAREIVLVRDSTPISQLNPGMPERVAFFWERNKDSPVPAELRVVVTALEFREETLSLTERWRPNEDAYTLVTADVIDKRGSDPSPSPTGRPSPPASPRPTSSSSPSVRPTASASPRPA